MIHTRSLFVYPDMRAALSAIDSLLEDYLKTHKRKATIDLTICTLSSPFDRSARRIVSAPEEIEVRIKWLKGQEKEVEWFVEAVK